MTRPLRVLFVEDSEDDAALITRKLRRAGYDLTCRRVETEKDMERALAEESWDLILSDYRMPHFHAPAALSLARRLAPEVPFIVVSGTIGEETAVECMRAGARDYMSKSNLARMVAAVERELAEAARRREQAASQERLENELRHVQKMEAIGQLAGGVAHDFNNLLMVINTFAGLVRDAMPSGDARREDLDQVLRAADRAASLTRQLLAFSRRQPIEPRVVDLNGLIRDVDKMLRRTIGEDIELKIGLSETRAPVFIDPGQFEQVILNLAVNSRDAMPGGGQLTIETREGSAAHPEIGEHVVLEVEDTGVGMTEEVQANAFEPFFTTKDSGKGTGLGLSTVYGLIKQAGGEIFVESIRGQGTRFRILLPRSSQDAATPARRDTAPRELRGNETVLVVEDESLVRRAAVRMLERNGYKVLEASDGDEALRLFERHDGEVDLLLTDVVMPAGGGRGVADTLKAACPQLKVLFMTGYTDSSVAHYGVLQPGVELLEKPFTEARLMAKIRRVLTRADTTTRESTSRRALRCRGEPDRGGGPRG